MANEKILIIDDERTARVLLAEELERAGYHVFQAVDGDVGLQVIRASKPDLIISDVLMPQVDGNMLLKTIRDREYSKDIPFIVLSARGQMKDYFESMGVDDFIEKPFETRDLLARVKKVLDGCREAKEEKEAQERAKSGPVKKSVIILDDNEKMVARFLQILADEPYDLRVAKTITECLDMAVTRKPDLIGLRFYTDGIGRKKPVAMMLEIPHVTNIPFFVYGENFREEDKAGLLKEGVKEVVEDVNDKKFLEAVKKVIG